MYDKYIEDWKRYAVLRQVDSISPPLNVAVNYLANLVTQGKSYSALCMARSALACYINIQNTSDSFGNIPEIKRFMKGVFETKPRFPLKCKVGTWDVNKVLSFFSTWYPCESLTLKELTIKCVIPMALLSGQRGQTLYSLDTSHMSTTEERCTFFISSLLKHSRRGCHQAPLEFVAFDKNPQLCVVNTIQTYLNKQMRLGRKTKQQNCF